MRPLGSSALLTGTLASQVRAAGMRVGLKNAVELIPTVVNYFDFAINESCNEYNECDVGARSISVSCIRNYAMVPLLPPSLEKMLLLLNYGHVVPLL